jgi:hypothetical protein
VAKVRMTLARVHLRLGPLRGLAAALAAAVLVLVLKVGSLL